MGHEKFVVRCTDELTILHFIDFIKRTDAMSMSEASRYALQQNDRRRALCEGYYEGINVCMEGGPQAALSGIENDLDAAISGLSDPLTRADDYDLYISARARLTVEMVALKKLIDDPSTYCGAK